MKLYVISSGNFYLEERETVPTRFLRTIVLATRQYPIVLFIEIAQAPRADGTVH